MERLTEINENKMAHFFPECFEKCGGIGYSRKCDRCDLLDRVCDKLGEYEDLEEQGKLIILPCAAGDTVYEVQNTRKRIQPYEIIAITIGRTGYRSYMWELKNGKGAYSNINGFGDSRLGVDIFLTQEEADAALKKMKG